MCVCVCFCEAHSLFSAISMAKTIHIRTVKSFSPRRPFSSCNLLIILRTKIFTLFPFFLYFFIHIFLRLCRTRPESLICTNFCLLFGFYDRKMNIYIYFWWFVTLSTRHSAHFHVDSTNEEIRNKLFARTNTQYLFRLVSLKSQVYTHIRLT